MLGVANIRRAQVCHFICAVLKTKKLRKQDSTWQQNLIYDDMKLFVILTYSTWCEYLCVFQKYYCLIMIRFLKHH